MKIILELNFESVLETTINDDQGPSKTLQVLLSPITSLSSWQYG